LGAGTNQHQWLWPFVVGAVGSARFAAVRKPATESKHCCALEAPRKAKTTRRIDCILFILCLAIILGAAVFDALCNGTVQKPFWRAHPAAGKDHHQFRGHLLWLLAKQEAVTPHPKVGQTGGNNAIR